MTLKRMTPTDDAHSSTAAAAEDMRQDIAEARKAMKTWDAQAAAVISSLPPGPTRARFEERRVEEARAAETLWPTIEKDRRLDLAQDRRERARDLLHEATGMRVELVEGPLRDAIRNMHGCASRYVESTHLTERTDAGAVVWTGIVHTFDIIGSAPAAQVYAWSHQTDGGKDRFVAVLAVPPITMPQKAVQAAIVAEARGAK